VRSSESVELLAVEKLDKNLNLARLRYSFHRRNGCGGGKS
jgi:hypothetical protein